MSGWAIGRPPASTTNATPRVPIRIIDDIPDELEIDLRHYDAGRIAS
jgi:hypothetical protein